LNAPITSSTTQVNTASRPANTVTFDIGLTNDIVSGATAPTAKQNFRKISGKKKKFNERLNPVIGKYDIATILEAIKETSWQEHSFRIRTRCSAKYNPTIIKKRSRNLTAKAAVNREEIYPTVSSY
jgi:hypothetical protein